MNSTTPSTIPAVATVMQSDNLQALQRVMDKTFEIFNGMADKERVTQKSLIEKVSESLGLKAEVVKPLVNLAVKQYSGVTVLRGRKGGIIKGVVVTKKAEDTRPRCASCKQVIRAKRTTTTPSESETVHATTAEEVEVNEKDSNSDVEDELENFLAENEDESLDDHDDEDEEEA